jgi:methionine sulfoxide reductase heme-binding subunit
VRVSATTLIILGAIVALVALGITDQVLPAADDRTVQLRPWIAARALGVTAYLLLALEVTLGLLLSHPRMAASWRKTRQVFPWHEMTTVFLGAFLALHIALLAADEFAGVGWIGVFVPGTSTFRTPAIAVGSIATYALVITAITAKWTRLLPAGWWLRVHRFTAVAFLLTWMHAVLAGTDGNALTPLYVATGLLILALGVHRWWSARTAARRSVTTAIPAGAPGLNLVRPEAAVAQEEAR